MLQPGSPPIQPIKKQLSSFDNFIYIVKSFFCWEVEIKYPDMYSYYNNKETTKQLCWESIEIPVLQYAICIIQSVLCFFPESIWGNSIGGVSNVFIFNTFVTIFLTAYLALRFAWVTEEHRKITECDSFVIQTVVFIMSVNYLYYEFLRL
jgi:hypothetical protein